MQALVNWEISEADRIIDQNGPWVLFCPFASGTPFQLWLTSTGPGEKHDFFSQSEVQLEQLAELLQRAVIRLESVLPNVPYNFVVHVPPRSFIEKPISPCLIEIFPRINKTAGFEWATDCLINQVPPELAARQLRNNQEK